MRFLALILVAAALLRLPALEHAPPPLNQDEASRLYDAWSLLDTGTDRTGRSWPFFLESYGEGDFTAALSTYITIPFVALLGPTVIAVRLPDALLSVVTVALVWLWVRRAHSECVATLAAIFLAFDPWHVLVTRTGWEFGYAPFFLAAGMYAADLAGLLPGSRQSERSFRWAICAATMLAFSAWTYPATRMVTPLLCAALVVCNRSYYVGMLRKPAGRNTIMVFTVSAITAGAPLWITMLNDPGRLAARARIAMLDFNLAALPTSIPRVIGFYLSYFNPMHLVTHPEDITTIGIPGVGLHLWAVAPFMVIGFLLLIARCRSDVFARTLLAWLLLTPIPAAICDDIQPHMIRVISAMVLWPILGALGVDWVWNRLASGQGSSRRLLTTAYAILFMVNSAYFAHQYFRAYPTHAEFGFQTQLIRAMQYVMARQKEADFVLVTNRANQAYIYALLYAPIPPKQLRADPLVVARGPVNFHQVIRVGRFFFTPQDPVNFPDAQQLFQQAWSALPVGARGFVIEMPGYFPAGDVVASFPWAEPASSPGGYEVRRWQKE